MSDKVIVTYFLLAILILYMKLGGNDDSMDLFDVGFIVYIYNILYIINIYIFINIYIIYYIYYIYILYIYICINIFVYIFTNLYIVKSPLYLCPIKLL